MNAKQTELLARLEKIVDDYVTDPALATRLKAEIDPKKVKYVLAEIESVKSIEFSSSDRDSIKDIYFHFC